MGKYFGVPYVLRTPISWAVGGGGGSIPASKDGLDLSVHLNSE